MPHTIHFTQFADRALPTLEARMNFNRQLAESTNQLNSDDELLDYWQSIAPTFTRFIGTATDSAPRLDLLKAMGNLAFGEADYYQSLIDFLSAKSIRAPDTDDLKPEDIRDMTIIYVKIMCKQYLLRENEFELKTRKSDEITAMFRKHKKSKGASSISIRKRDLTQFQRDVDEVYVESCYLGEISDLFREFLSNCDPVLADFFASLSPQRFIEKDADNSVVLYAYSTLKLTKKIEIKRLALQAMFNSNKAKLSTDQQREYFTFIVDLSRNIQKFKEESEHLSKNLYDCNVIADTEKLLTDYYQLGRLLLTIETISTKVSLWITQYYQTHSNMMHQEALESVICKEESQAELTQQFSVLSVKKQSKEDNNSITDSDSAAESRKALEPVNDLPARLQVLTDADQDLKIGVSDEAPSDSSYASSSDGTLWQWDQTKRSRSADSVLTLGDTDPAVVEHQKFQIIATNLKRHKETFQQIFTHNIHLRFSEKDLMAIIEALGGKVVDGSGSRKRICLNHVFSDTLSPSGKPSTSTTVVHSPHGRKARSRDGKLPSFCVKNYVNVIARAGFTPEKIWPADFTTQTALSSRKSTF